MTTASAVSPAVNAIGLIAAVCTTISFVPQLIRIWRLRSAREISLTMFLVYSLGVFLWLFYGILIHSVPVILANAVSLVLSLAMLALKFRFDRKEKGAPRAPIKHGDAKCPASGYSWLKPASVCPGYGLPATGCYLQQSPPGQLPPQHVPGQLVLLFAIEAPVRASADSENNDVAIRTISFVFMEISFQCEKGRLRASSQKRTRRHTSHTERFRSANRL